MSDESVFVSNKKASAIRRRKKDPIEEAAEKKANEEARLKVVQLSPAEKVKAIEANIKAEIKASQSAKKEPRIIKGAKPIVGQVKILDDETAKKLESKKKASVKEPPAKKDEKPVIAAKPASIEKKSGRKKAIVSKQAIKEFIDGGGMSNLGSNIQVSTFSSEEKKTKESTDAEKRFFKQSPAGRRRRKKEIIINKEMKKTELTTPRAQKRVVKMAETIVINELAKQLSIKPGELLKKLIGMGVMVTLNQSVDYDTACIICSEYEYEVESTSFDETELLNVILDDPKDLKPRAPIVTIMGHVDHGKTSLLDFIRKSSVAKTEAGGITQHIGAYSVDVNGKKIVFIDTPGHEAFTDMRSRGAQITDIVIIVVAAEDGIMPQTEEAISHSKAASVPIVVAINKMDKPDANPEKIKQDMTKFGLVAEEWGGTTAFLPISAKTGQGIPELLDMLTLQAEILELKANPDKAGSGVVIEGKLEKGRGPVATVIIKEGTVFIGNSIICGTVTGRVRAMMDHNKNNLTTAGPATPVEILGLEEVPDAGSILECVANEKAAKIVGDHRKIKRREKELAKSSKVSLEELYKQIKAGDVKELNVILKTDVFGSVDALRSSLTKLSDENAIVKVIHGAVGAVKESDVKLAIASNAIIIGFNIRPERSAAVLADSENIQIRTYTIIYDVIDDIKKALTGLLEPKFKEEYFGRAEVKNTFNITDVGTIAGCAIIDGKFARSAQIRLLRDSAIIFTGKISSLKRFKDDVREVKKGIECGIGIENYNDVKVGDVIEAFQVIEVK